MTARTGRPIGKQPRITDLQVVAIYSTARAGADIKALAAEYGIHYNTVYDIKNRKGRFRKIINAAVGIGWADNDEKNDDTPPPQRHSTLFSGVPKNNILHFALVR